MSKKILILAFGISHISSISEAIKIFLVKNKNISFVIFTDSISLKNNLNESGSIEIVLSGKDNFNEDTFNDYDFVIDFSKEKTIKNYDFTFYLSIEDEKNSSILIPFYSEDFSKTTNDIRNLQKLLKRDLNIYYIENDKYKNDNLEKQLANLANFKGVVPPTEFFNLNNGIYVINGEKLEFIKSFYSALNNKKNQNKKKGVADYFSKMVFSFQRNETYSKATYNLFDYLFEAHLGFVSVKLDSFLTSSEIILAFNFLKQIS